MINAGITILVTTWGWTAAHWYLGTAALAAGVTVTTALGLRGKGGGRS